MINASIVIPGGKNSWMAGISLAMILLFVQLPLIAQQIAASKSYSWTGNLGDQDGKLCHRLSDNSFIIAEKPAKDQVDLVAYRNDFKEHCHLC